MRLALFIISISQEAQIDSKWLISSILTLNVLSGIYVIINMLYSLIKVNDFEYLYHKQEIFDDKKITLMWT